MRHQADVWNNQKTFQLDISGPSLMVIEGAASCFCHCNSVHCARRSTLLMQHVMHHSARESLVESQWCMGSLLSALRGAKYIGPDWLSSGIQHCLTVAKLL